MTDLVFPVAYVAFSILFVTGLVLALRRARARAEQEQKERDEQEAVAIRSGIDRGILLEDGRPACVICKTLPATEKMVVIRRSWLDRLTPLRDLYALTPRFTVRDGSIEYANMVCKPCKPTLLQAWNEFLAGKRTKVQETLSHVHAEISYMERGGMIQALQERHVMAVERLQSKTLGGQRLLPARATSPSKSNGLGEDHISLPPMSTVTSRTDDADPN